MFFEKTRQIECLYVEIYVSVPGTKYSGKKTSRARKTMVKLTVTMNGVGRHDLFKFQLTLLTQRD